jgi:hypothetical protein
LKASDLGQLLVQGTDRQIIHPRHRRAERKHAIAARLVEHLLDDAATGDQPRPLDPGDVRGRRRQRGRLVHVITGLRPRADQPLVFEVGVGLQHRRMTDVELRAHLAHRRDFFAGLVNAAANVFGQLLGDALVEQKAGHDRPLARVSVQL